jgi:tripartite-type tricarboxylate transporter receptor subunit TctC
VPYKGGNPTVADALAGSIPMVILTAATILPLANAGKLRALAVIEDRRAKIAPGLPTVRETLPAYHVPDLWFGFLAPAGLPRPLLGRLQAELQKAFGAPEVRLRLESLGFEILDGGGDLEARIRRDVAVFRQVAVSAGIKPE